MKLIAKRWEPLNHSKFPISQKELYMTPLRRRFIEDMVMRNLAQTTQSSYVQQVSMFARHFRQSPELLGLDEIREYQLYLAREKELAPVSIGVAVGALRFLYNVTLKKHWPLDEAIPMPKMPFTLPVVLSPEEVLQFLDSVEHLKQRTILTACYAAGLRVSEAVHLKATHIDSRRMVLRVDQGKGRRDRYVMLSERLLELLRHWWRSTKLQHWLFPGKSADKPITRHAVEKACQIAHGRSGLSKPLTPHSLRHASAVHMLENGTDVRTIQLLLGHRSLATTANYLRIAASRVCSATSPLDLLPRPTDAKAFLPPSRLNRRYTLARPQAGTGGHLSPLRRRLSSEVRRLPDHCSSPRDGSHRTMPHRCSGRSRRSV
jgi:integrase/recombinase XerD